jgi:hypothetical protein
MVDDVLRCALWELRVEQGRTASLREFLSAGATAQQAETVMAIYLPDDEVVGSGVAKQLALALTQAKVSKSGRCMRGSFRTVGRCLKDFIRPDHVCQPPLR